jgi:hypothetical protein
VAELDELSNYIHDLTLAADYYAMERSNGDRGAVLHSIMGTIQLLIEPIMEFFGDDMPLAEDEDTGENSVMAGETRSKEMTATKLPSPSGSTETGMYISIKKDTVDEEKNKKKR